MWRVIRRTAVEGLGLEWILFMPAHLPRTVAKVTAIGYGHTPAVLLIMPIAILLASKLQHLRKGKIGCLQIGFFLTAV